MDLYREYILEHYRNPKNFGHLPDPDIVVEDGNVSCGDKIVVELKKSEQKGKKVVSDIRFSGVGCAVSIASASLLTESVKGKTVDEILKLGREDILELLGISLTPSRTKCALLSLEVLQKAVSSLK